MRFLFGLFGVVFLLFGLWSFSKIVTDIQFTLAIVGVSAGLILLGIAVVIDRLAAINKRLTKLIGAENPKPVSPPQANR